MKVTNDNLRKGKDINGKNEILITGFLGSGKTTFIKRCMLII